MADENKLRQLAAELDDAEDEITEEHHVHIHPPKGAKFEAGVDETGRLKAISISDDEQTPTDPPRPISVAPKSGIPGIVAAAGSGAVGIIKAASSPLGLVALLLLVIALFVYLRFR